MAGCGTSGVQTGSRQAQQTRAPLPAGRQPSTISKMVCAPEAQREIAGALGVKATVATPTWVAHRYSCRYVYPDGALELSVQELSSWDQTYAYFHSLAAGLGDTAPLANLGQGAFTTRNGSVVVRKDWKVLLVDISALPSQFGVPPTSAADVAQTVADVILGCWAGD
jgi:hypothetical protein